MSILAEKDYRAILDTLYALNCCENREDFIDALMPSVARMFRAECITFHLIKGSPGQIKVLESRAFKSDGRGFSEDKVFPALYKAGLYQKSPLLSAALSSSRTVLKTGETISYRDWEKSDLFNNFILPQNLYKELFMTLRWKNRLEGMITLWRSRNQGDYLEDDVAKANLLAPHLVVAARNVSAAARVESLRRNFARAADTGSEGLLLLDQSLQPIYFDSKARSICFRLNGQRAAEAEEFAAGEFPVPRLIVEDCSELLQQLKLDEQPILWPKERIVITEDHWKVRLQCSLIRRSDQIRPQPNFVIDLQDLTDSADARNLPAGPPLSKRELDIIYYVVRGFSYGEIAQNLCISKLTVHTHIKNIYSKLGAKNRIELYRYVQSPSYPH